jgi:mono/diheme cytochrome c family protein
MRRWLAALALGCALAGPARGETQALRFLADGAELRTLALGELAARCPPRVVEVQDPYYAKRKRFQALALRCVLSQGFGAGAERALADADVLLRARDGYTRGASGAQLLTEGGFVAFADADLGSGFEPIDRRQVDPAPFYLVWQGEGRSDTHQWPWPYQLVEIERVPFERRFPHVLPDAAAAPDVHAGFAVFRRECISCHAMNGEGGRVGPELNVPRSIVEYRDRETLRAFIRDPASFRYTSMPSHRHLTDAELDGLLAYFAHMSRRKHDPGPGPGPSH